MPGSANPKEPIMQDLTSESAAIRADQTVKIAHLELKIDNLEKRLSDFVRSISTAAGLVVGVFAVIFGVVSLTYAWKFDNEVGTLQRLEDNLVKKVNEALGAIGGEPILDVLNRQRQNPDISPVQAVMFKDKDETPMIELSTVFANSGDAMAELSFVKIYSNSPLQIGQAGSDVAGFEFEGWVTPDLLNPKSLPPGVSVPYYLRWSVPEQTWQQLSRNPQEHKVLLKVFYGNDKTYQKELKLMLIPGPG
jgi:hypothetical protein